MRADDTMIVNARYAACCADGGAGAEVPCAETCLSRPATSPPVVPAPRPASPERPHVRGDEVVLGDVQTAPTPGSGSTPAPSVWLGERVGLSAHEGAIVSLIVLGLSNREIAGALYMSMHSVQTHIRSAYRTMGVTKRTQAISWGVNHGLRLTTSPARLDDGGQQ